MFYLSTNLSIEVFSKLFSFNFIIYDCGHKETADVIRRDYGDKVIFMEQPDQSDIDVPKKEFKFKGYFKIARHYGWALNETLIKRGYKQVFLPLKICIW